jgi:hypothetical protein
MIYLIAIERIYWKSFSYLKHDQKNGFLKQNYKQFNKKKKPFYYITLDYIIINMINNVHF